MENHFVTYKQALALKELGFDEPCLSVFYSSLVDTDEDTIKFILEYTESQYYAQKGYVNGILRPLKSQVFEWARKAHNISHAMKPIIGSKNGYDSYPILGWDSDLFILTKGATNSYYMGYPVGEWFTATLDCFDEGDTLEDRIDIRTYNEAESYCIDKLIQTIKKDLLWRITL